MRRKMLDEDTQDDCPKNVSKKDKLLEGDLWHSDRNTYNLTALNIRFEFCAKLQEN